MRPGAHAANIISTLNVLVSNSKVRNTRQSQEEKRKFGGRYTHTHTHTMGGLVSQNCPAEQSPRESLDAHGQSCLTLAGEPSGDSYGAASGQVLPDSEA